MKKKYDFSGWATRNNLRCSDGRTILQDAFKHNDGKIVPLVWNHQHGSLDNVLGHALLENRPEGVYAYCTLNETEAGRNAKILIESKDISALSIYANRLQQNGGNVLHGDIREVSLVLAGANPGAFIDNVITHADDSENDEAVIYTGYNLELAHADQIKENEKEEKEEMDENNSGKTVKEIFDTLNEEQKNVVYALIGQALESQGEEEMEQSELYEYGGDDTMKHNVFENERQEKQEVLTHAEMEAIIKDGKRYGSLKESCLQHGITNIEYLFPDYKTINNEPDFISRPMDWVSKVMGSVGKTPFSRIKTIHADITADEARALGYMKGHKKKEEVFTLLKRTTEPTTVYKKQKLDRDDVIDITDFDVVAFMKKEMRVMLDEEIARAILIGDGRLSDSEDKIPETKIRPIMTDDDLYTIKAEVSEIKNINPDDPSAKASAKARSFIRSAIKARKDYRGSGAPVLFTTEDLLTDCLLIEDATGRIIYDSVDKLATALRVSEIITVPVMEGCVRTGTDGLKYDVLGIIVNLKDYKIGADKGGAVNMFDDFDIDYNAQKYLIETRCSGALVKPYSAIVVEMLKPGQAS